MVRLLEAKALTPYRVWLRYDDGASGEVDLADLAGRGVFAAWGDAGAFAALSVGPHGSLEWPGDLDLCADAMYLRLTGKPVHALAEFGATARNA